MAKKSSKGKDKKLARKAGNERAAALAARVRALNEAWSGAGGADPLAAQYPAFTRYERQGLTAALRFYPAAALPSQLLDWALGLTRQHMAELYEACPGWGWSDAKKRAELADPAARYLIAFQQPAAAEAAQQQPQQPQQGAAPAAAAPLTDAAAAAALAAPAAAAGAEQQQENSAAAGNGGGSSGSGGAPQLPGQPLAFLHFRFEEEEGEAVLYCYEIQVAEAAQGKGLGKFLMQLFELVGRRSGVDRLMLTVFHANQAALALYRKLGYVLDDSSPDKVDPADPDNRYSILMKVLPKPAAAAAAAAAPKAAAGAAAAAPKPAVAAA